MAQGRIFVRVAAALMLIALAGCGAQFNSIHRRVHVGAGTELNLIDAKQRAIITVATSASGSSGDSGTTPATARFCAEASPDVFSVYAAAAAASGTFGRTSASALTAAASLAASSAEKGATIPRTQTVNLLKEVMYRTCERHLNGGINDLELPLQAIRDQRLIVATLAIEQLTGAVTAKPVVIGASGSAEGGASSQEAAVRIDDAWRANQKAEAAKLTATDARRELDTAAPKCADIKKDPTTGAFKPEEVAKQTKCATADAQVNTATAEATATKAHYDALKQASVDGGVPVAVKTELSADANPGGLDRAHDQAIEQVATAVKEIVKANYDQDEILLMCVKLVGTSESGSQFADKGKRKLAADECWKYINAKIEGIAADERLRTAQSRAAAARVAGLQGSDFDRFWPVVSQDDQVVTAKLDALIEAAIASHPGTDKGSLRVLKGISDRDRLMVEFQGLSPGLRRILLAEAAK